MAAFIGRTTFSKLLMTSALAGLLLILLFWTLGSAHAESISSQGRIWYVDASKVGGANDGSSWSDAFTKLQSALDHARPGDEIWVAQGVYKPTRLLDPNDPRSATFVLADGVRLMGGFSGAPGTENDRSVQDWERYPTVLSGDIDSNDIVDARGVVTDVENIEGENAYHVVYARNVAQAHLNGFIISAGSTLGSFDFQESVGAGVYIWASHVAITNSLIIANYVNLNSGAGMMVQSGSSVTMKHVTFESNKTPWAGGGLDNRADSEVVLENVTFENNGGYWGGGMYNAGKALLRNVVFSNNRGVEGGGMYNKSSDSTLDHVTFMGNQGSGMAIDDSSPTLIDVAFRMNHAINGGGAVIIGDSQPVLINASFVANQAEKGGGVYSANGGSPMLVNATFVGNRGDAGKAIYNENNASTLINVTIAGQGTAAVYNHHSQLAIYNSIFWTNQAPAIINANESVATIQHTLLQDGCPDGADCSDIFLAVDPMFVRTPDPGDRSWDTLDDNDYGNLQLKTESPAINMGDNQALPRDIFDLDGDGDVDEPIPFDMNGYPRIVEGTVDLGAYEAYGLRLLKRTSTPHVAFGEAFTYTITFHNHTDSATIVSMDIVDDVPANYVVQSIAYEGIPLIQISQDPLTWRGENIPPGGMGRIYIRGFIQEGISPPWIVTNTATLTFTSDVSIPSDQQTSVAVHIPGIYYVDARKVDGANNGSSWADALIDLQSALNWAQEGDEIWVAQGVYKPSQLRDPNDPRSATFALIHGVSLFGGFPGAPGTEEDWSVRDWERYPTVLSGDIDNNDIVNDAGVVTGVQDIQGDNAYHVVWGDALYDVTTLDGFIVTAGDATHPVSGLDQHGGGMFIRYRSQPQLRNLLFMGNYAFANGGGLYVTDQSDLALTHVTFENNFAAKGGGMYVGDDSDIALTDVLFRKNAGERGGGLAMRGDHALLNQVTFRENHAIQEGGGMINWTSATLNQTSFIQNASEARAGGLLNAGRAVLNDAVFAYNSARSDGGGVYNRGAQKQLDIKRGIFYANVAQGYGGAMQNKRAGATLVNVSFMGNASGLGGGAIANKMGQVHVANATFSANTTNMDGGAVHQQYGSSMTLAQVSFASNVAGGRGGSIFNLFEGQFDEPSEVMISNAILYGAQPEEIVSPSSCPVTITHSLVEGGCPANAVCESILDGNPRFVRDPDPGDGDWNTLEDNNYGNLHLRPDSPAIDTGDNQGLPDDVLDLDEDGDTTEPLPLDFDGHARIINDIVDLGAYEHPGTRRVPIPSRGH